MKLKFDQHSLELVFVHNLSGGGEIDEWKGRRNNHGWKDEWLDSWFDGWDGVDGRNGWLGRKRKKETNKGRHNMNSRKDRWVIQSQFITAWIDWQPIGEIFLKYYCTEKHKDDDEMKWKLNDGMRWDEMRWDIRGGKWVLSSLSSESSLAINTSADLSKERRKERKYNKDTDKQQQTKEKKETRVTHQE